MNFNGIFRKNVTYDNIRSHQKSGLCPLSRKHNFGKTTRGRGQIASTTFLGFRYRHNTTKLYVELKI